MTDPGINHICTLLEGGAGIAARRLHDALPSQSMSSRMTLFRGQPAPDRDVYTPVRTLARTVERELARHLHRRTASQVDGLASFAFPRSGLADHLNAQDRQILNLHWINFDMISIAEIGRLKHPVVWTLHDMWPFCGAEHYTEDTRWRTGYGTDAKNPLRDVSAWVWARKVRHWRNPMHIVTPSNWMADCARQSALMRDWPVRVIPNAIDTELWTPIAQADARKALGLPPDVPMVLFGAMGGSSDPRKGFALLREALLHLHTAGRHLHLLVFGADEADMDLPFPVHSMGAVTERMKLRRIYAAADLFALPSRQDNLPNTGVEALMSGTPLVGFRIGGLPDLVPDQGLRQLARAFDTEDLARAMSHVLDCQMQDSGRGGLPGTEMARAARAHAHACYAATVVARQYIDLYREIWEGR